MGNRLDKPKTDKDTDIGFDEEDGLDWAVSSMQGWRVTMEDAHIIATCKDSCALSNTNNTSSCGVEKSDTAIQSGTDDDKSSTNTKQESMPGIKHQDSSTDPSKNEGDQSKGQSEKRNCEMLDPKGGDDALKLPPHHYFFCVFDGHAGEFAAQYAGKNLLPVILEQDAFQEYERIWREPTLSTGDASSSSMSVSKELGNKKLKTELHSKNMQQGQNKQVDSHSQNHPSNKNKVVTNQKLLLQRALEDAFVELDLMLMQDMVRQNLIIPPPPPPLTGTDCENSLPVASNNATTGDADGTPEAMEKEDDNASNTAAKSQKVGGGPIPGTTAVAVLVTPDWIMCANLGDSRASLLVSSSNDDTASNKKKGSPSGEEEQDPWTIVKLSEDHKPDLPKEQARIEADNGFVKAGRVGGELSVSRAFGDFDLKESYPPQLYDYESSFSITKRQNQRRNRRMQARLQGDVSSNGIDEKSDGEKEDDMDWEHLRTIAQQLKVSPFPEVFAHPRGKPKYGIEEGVNHPNGREKVLLLGCDGIWDVMTNERCHNLVQERLAKRKSRFWLSLWRAAEEIFDICLEKESDDNMTMIVVHFSEVLIDGGKNQTTASDGVSRKGQGSETLRTKTNDEIVNRSGETQVASKGESSIPS
ncbi:unnamed protein product [Cylindrotheca closterium]|uniref:protein-serine/threonine phosphatase n=1 Tax=Cylindrotheca closterium TaxID=2856 RepID=A0AAD2FUQ8_9STRA|nr:unnamed protein product [Cylindrotheca closterium]